MADWPQPYTTVAVTLAAVYLTPAIVRLVFKNVDFRDLFFGRKHQRKETPGVVYLHMFPRSCTRQVLNLSPFAVKLETWLRLKKIPYEVVETMSFSRTTKQIPFIRLDGEEVADTLFIVDFLTERFRLDPLEGGTEEEQAVTRAFGRMIEEGLALNYFWFRYYYLANEFFRLFHATNWNAISKMVLRGIGQGMHARAVSGGLARHQPHEIAKIGQDDIKAISKYLGDKSFMLGEHPRLIDCIVFGHLSQLVGVDLPYPHKVTLAESSNVQPYMERIKSTLWPDWDALVNMEPFS